MTRPSFQHDYNRQQHTRTNGTSIGNHAPAPASGGPSVTRLYAGSAAAHPPSSRSELGWDDLRPYTPYHAQAAATPTSATTTGPVPLPTPFSSYAGPSASSSYDPVPKSSHHAGYWFPQSPGRHSAQGPSGSRSSGGGAGSRGRVGSPSTSRYNPHIQTQPTSYAFDPTASSAHSHLPPVPPFPGARPNTANRSISPSKGSGLARPRPPSRSQPPAARHRRISTAAAAAIPARVRTKASPVPSLQEYDPEGTSGEEGEAEGGDKSKLEVKREKNRLKQRNLRLRRANHVSELEASLEQIKADHGTLQAKYEEIERREAGLNKYLAALEDVMRRHGLTAELRAVQAAWQGMRAAEVGIDFKVRPGEGCTAEAGETEGVRKKRKLDQGADADVVVTSAGNFLGPFPYLVDPAEQTHPSRPRTSTSTFTPDRIDNELFPFAPSPRSIRIEDLLSPSFIHKHSSLSDDGETEPEVPVSAYTINTPAPGASNSTGGYPWLGGASAMQTPTAADLGGVAMQLQLSSDSIGGRSAVSGVSAAGLNTVEGYLDGLYGTPMGIPGAINPTPLPYTYPLALPGPFAADSPGTLAAPPLHPSIHTARILLRALLAPQASKPISHCTLPALTPAHQTILLTAIYNLTNPAFRELVNQAQVKDLPREIMKVLFAYSQSADADIRVELMPIAILRGRIVGFLDQGLPFDITAFITHVLADGRVFGDTADPDAWEMSDTFWDVWSGWFKVGRTVCKSLQKWRRRYGHTGANAIEILLGLEAENSRMKELIGRPEGWKRPEVPQMSPDPSVLTPITLVA